MTFNNANVRIPRTTALEARLTRQMKFLFGSDVQVGTVYDGWEDGSGNQHAQQCKTLHYDGQHLYVHIMGTDTIMQMGGDIADYHGTLMADHIGNSYNVEKLRERVDKYMSENQVAEYTTEIGRHALWQAKRPSSMIDESVYVYELTRGENFNA